jgi:hypothetical protein
VHLQALLADLLLPLHMAAAGAAEPQATPSPLHHAPPQQQAHSTAPAAADPPKNHQQQQQLQLSVLSKVCGFVQALAAAAAAAASHCNKQQRFTATPNYGHSWGVQLWRSI